MTEQEISLGSENLTLFKNSKGYNWRITIPNLDLDKLEELNNAFKERFGKKKKEGVTPNK